MKHDFWSILGQIMYFAFGLSVLKARKQSMRLIPVAIGTTIQELASRTPEVKDKLNLLSYSPFLMNRFCTVLWIS